MKTLWNRFASLMDRFAEWFMGIPDWSDPDNAPPAFEDVTNPHAYEPAKTLPCCALCGGGKRHAIHSV
jgi:hypothetical protein